VELDRCRHGRTASEECGACDAKEVTWLPANERAVRFRCGECGALCLDVDRDLHAASHAVAA
jgi:hypothetical protein